MKIIYVVIGGIVLAALMAAGGFFGGMTYAQAQAQNTINDFARQRGASAAAANTNTNTNTNDACGFGVDTFRSGNQGSGQNGGHGDQSGGQGGGQVNDQNGGHAGGQLGGGGSFAQLGSCVARGQIKSVNGDTVEISTADKVVTIKVSDQTVITKTDRGALSDLKTGDRVTVFSRESGDTPTASGIQLQRAAGQGQ